VRGTIFDVLVDRNETQVFLHEGQVAVTNLNMPDQPILLFAGQMTKVLLQRPPDQPNTFRDGRNDGMFRPGRGDGPADNRRVADGAGPNFGRDGSQPGGNGRPGQGRGGFPPADGQRPDAGRNGPPPGGSGAPGPGKRP